MPKVGWAVPVASVALGLGMMIGAAVTNVDAAAGDLLRTNNSGGSQTLIPKIAGTPCWRSGNQTFRPDGVAFSACSPTTSTTTSPTTTTVVSSTSTTVATTSPPVTSTTVPASTSSTSTVPAPGLLYSNSFDTAADMDRLQFDIHRGSYSAFQPFTFNGDHDMSCGAPTTTRTVHEAIFSELVWYCGTPAVADAHFMTGMNTESYNTISFAPVNSDGTIIFPGTANRLCWNQNLTGLGARKWINVLVISDDRLAARNGDLSFVSPDHAGNAGDGSGGTTDPLAAVASGDDFLYVNVENTVEYYSPLGNQFEWTLLNNITDKATRYRNCIIDNGNNTVTRTQARPGGTNTVTMPGRFPAGPRVFIIEDVSYTPDKAAGQGAPPAVSNPYTWHWDQIEVSVA